MNLKRQLFFVSFFAVSLNLTAQKLLTVKNAVENQWREFYPEQLNNPQWIPGTGTLTYHDENWRGIIAKESGKKGEVL